MAIDKLSVEVGINADGFTTGARTIATASRQVQENITLMKRVFGETANSIDGSIRAIKSYTDSTAKIGTSLDALKRAQDSFVQGLNREFETLGLNKRQLQEYTAQQLGLGAQTAIIIKQIDDKRSKLAAEAAAQARATLETQAAARAAAIAAEAEIALNRSLQEKIILLREGEDALIADKLAMGQYSEETAALMRQVNALTAAHKEAELAIKAKAEADALAAEESRRAGLAEREEAEEINRFITKLRERTIVMRDGQEALEREYAIRNGILPIYEREIEEINRLTAARKREAEEARAQAAADREAARTPRPTGGRGGHGGGLGATTTLEGNRLVDEITSGRTNQSLGTVSILLRSLGVAGEVTLGLGIAVGLLKGMIEPTNKAAENLQKMARDAQKLGVTLQTMQTLKTFADIVGADPEKLTQASGRINNSFAQAKSGNKKAADGFNAIGVDTKQNYSTYDLIIKMADAFNKMADGGRKAQIAQELLGRSGIELIPILNQGSQGLKEARELDERYGLQLEDSNGKQTKATQIGLQLAAANDENKKAMEGLGLVLLQAMGPTLIQLVTTFSKLTEQFIDSYKAGGKAKVTMDILAGTLKVLIITVGYLGTGLYQLVLAFNGLSYLLVGSALIIWVRLSDAIKETASVLLTLMTELYNLSTFNWNKLGEDANKGIARIVDIRHKTDEQVNAVSTKSVNKTFEAYVSARNAGQGFENMTGALLSDKPTRQYKTPLTPPDNNGEGAQGVAKPKSAGQNTEAELKGQLASLKAQITDTGSEYAKYQAILADPSSALSKATVNNQSLRASILALAGAIDDGKKALEAKKVFDSLQKQTDTDQKTYQASVERGILIANGASAADLARAASIGKIREQVQQAQPYIDWLNKQNVTLKAQHKPLYAIPDVAGMATADEDLKSKIAASDTSNTAETNLKNKFDEAQAEAVNREAQGYTKINAELAKYKAGLQELVSNVLPKERDQYQKIADQLVRMKANQTADTHIDGLEKDNRSLSDSMIANPQERALAESRQSANEKYDNYQGDVAAGVDTEKLKKEYADYVQYVALQNKKLAQDNPISELATKWSDVMGNMQKASATWIDSFVGDLMKGKMNFGQFAQEIIKQILQMAIQAMIAKTIIQPLMAMFGGGAGTLSMAETPDATFGSAGIQGLSSNFGAGVSMPDLAAVFHEGGVVGGFSRSRPVNPSWFANVPRYHTGGIAGLQPNEVPAILQKGEGVYTQQQMKSMSNAQGGTANVAVNIDNKSGMAMDGDHAGTRFDGEKWVVNIITTAMNKPGPLRTALKSTP